ncbi:AAA domain-containing protein [Ihubacter sp. rT4E-8]|uniref:AAA domain-containing protein n=1 Tax=Ihubacter sp. rT4E-8 TaxID=3242369 RepID=UPI003CF86B65
MSTTHSLRRSIPENYLLDYVIIDEASQVDLITGVLALSCCKNAIIVGDEKQLEQITQENRIGSKINSIPPRQEYDYFRHSILSSVLCLYNDKLPRTILREHYRCHPKIINFCNQEYYDGNLIPYTDTSMSESPLILYRTTEGNHMREVTKGDKKGIYNQRELDVIVEEVLKNPDLSEIGGTIGVVTPYRKQANKAAEMLSNKIQSDTVHKYQGRERDTMIMSTVLDSSYKATQKMKFVDDARMVNVSVSRAVKQFILVTDHDLFFQKGKHITHLIRYILYNTLDEKLVNSNVVSVFDLLYKRYSEKLIPLKKRMNPNTIWESEEVIRVLLEDILSREAFCGYEYRQQILLRNLLNDMSLLKKEEVSFVNHRASLDFIIFRKQDKSCVLVIEVDGFAFHENNPVQLQRDAMKDRILKRYGIPVLRLPTNSSGIEKKIEEGLKNSDI